jgi:hypothetical protein
MAIKFARRPELSAKLGVAIPPAKPSVGIKRQNHVLGLGGKTMCRVTGALDTGVCKRKQPFCGSIFALTPPTPAMSLGGSSRG